MNISEVIIMTNGTNKKVGVYFRMYTGAGTKVGDFINELERELEGVSTRMSTHMFDMNFDIEEEGD